MCSDELPVPIKRQGFKGVQTLPRQLTYEPLTKTLRAYPVQETNKLRGKQVGCGAQCAYYCCHALSHHGGRLSVQDHSTKLVPSAAVGDTWLFLHPVRLTMPHQVYNATNAAVATFPQVTAMLAVSSVPGYSKSNTNSSSSSGGGNSKLSASTVTARQFEVQATFTLLPPGSSSTGNKVSSESGTRRSSNSIVQQPDEFALGVRIELGGGKYADAYIKGTVRSLAPQSPAYAISSLSVWFDRIQAGPGTNTTFMEGGPVPLPVDQEKGWTAPDTPLELSVWVDHGVVEIFALKGLARLTSRLYPEDDSVAWGVSAWAIPPEPTAGLTVDRAAAARVAETLRPPSVISGMYCWWCRLWTNGCKDTRCYSAIERWPKPKEWGALFDGQVWEMKSAWLPPSC